LIDLEVADMVAELIGASVLANDGTWVGEVSDVAFDKELQPRESDGAVILASVEPYSLRDHWRS
jgi:sporulation protein YlmC with PRC-barrel domain